MKVNRNTKSKDSKQHLCINCGRIVSNLKQHMRQFHVTKKWGYCCPVCQHFERCSDKNFMVRHLKTHSSELNIKITKFEVSGGYDKLERCHICKYTCLQEDTLASHLKGHQTENPFSTFDDKFSSTFEQLLNDTSNLLNKQKLN